MARKKPTLQPIDYGTKEMARKFTIVPRYSDPTTLTAKILDGSEVDRLLLRDAITPVEHGTLNTLTKKMHAYGFVGLKSPSYDGAIHADPAQVSAKKAELMRGAVALIDRMDRHPKIGRHLRLRLINMTLYDTPWGPDLEKLTTAISGLDDVFMRMR